ncbi:HEPN domain-containing protein [Alkaliphilus metalliredigens]|nr:HEPN domain-containing protein [Alkaliphilus metalliredigens]
MDWLEKSSNDIKAARILKENDCGYELVAFHSQQAAEKILKAYIINKAGVIISSHSLVFLCKEASKYEGSFKYLIKDCAFLNQYYIETRYPAEDNLVVSEEEVEECIKIAENLYMKVKKDLHS